MHLTSQVRKHCVKHTGCWNTSNALQVLHCPALSCSPAQPYVALGCPTLPDTALLCTVSHYHAMPCNALHGHVPPCHTLPCIHCPAKPCNAPQCPACLVSAFVMPHYCATTLRAKLLCPLLLILSLLVHFLSTDAPNASASKAKTQKLSGTHLAYAGKHCNHHLSNSHCWQLLL